MSDDRYSAADAILMMMGVRGERTPLFAEPLYPNIDETERLTRADPKALPANATGGDR